MNSEILLNAIKNKENKDIFIIGKGASIDAIALDRLKENIIINTNDSELLLIGDICTFHHGWVLDVLEYRGAKANLYVTDKTMPPEINSYLAKYVANTPEDADFIMHRFLSDQVYIEDSILITALKLANLIAIATGEKKAVYLLGFDFSVKSGFTDQMPIHMNQDESEYVERLLLAQERLLEKLLLNPEKLDIKVKHVGNRHYSSFGVAAFNTLSNGFQTTKESFKLNKVVNNVNSSLNSVKIVAEITTNHFGDLDRLKAMIIASKEAGADYIKLQKRDVESFYTDEKLNSEYISPFGTTFRDYRHGIELDEEAFKFVDTFCKSIDIGWFASILDIESYHFIKKFNPEIIKLPSTISEHKDFLLAVAEDFDKDVVISTGYTSPEYENFIIEAFSKVKNIYLLQCTSSYPTANEATQIGVVRHYYNLAKQNPKIIPGFSSHDIGSICSMMAVAAGAKMIEKHVKFGDVAWSHFDEVAVDLVNGDYQKVVADIRAAEMIVGGELKEIHSSEHHKYWK